MARKLILALAVIGLFAANVDAARRRGLCWRWSARRAARSVPLHDHYWTPQAVWNAYYRAMVKRDWDAAYRCLDRESRKQAVAGAAFAVLWFSSEDGGAGAAEKLARRHRVLLEAMIREICDFNAAAESRLLKRNETSVFVDDEESRALIETQAILLRHIPNHAAFYRDAMNAILATTEDDTPAATKDSQIRDKQPPTLTEVRSKGNRAQALYRTDAARVRGSEIPGERTIDFTFESGGWKIREYQ